MIISRKLTRVGRRVGIGVLAAAAVSAVLATPATATTLQTATGRQADLTCQRINGEEPDIEAIGCRPPLEEPAEDVTIQGPRRTFHCEVVFPADNGNVYGQGCFQTA